MIDSCFGLFRYSLLIMEERKLRGFFSFVTILSNLQHSILSPYTVSYLEDYSILIILSIHSTWRVHSLANWVFVCSCRVGHLHSSNSVVNAPIWLEHEATSRLCRKRRLVWFMMIAEFICSGLTRRTPLLILIFLVPPSLLFNKQVYFDFNNWIIQILE